MNRMLLFFLTFRLWSKNRLNLFFQKPLYMWHGQYHTLISNSSSKGSNSCMNMISYRIVFFRIIIIIIIIVTCWYEACVLFETPI